MVICFDATIEAKRALDALLVTGQFRDMSEAVSMALVNYQVIQQTVFRTGEMVLGSQCDPTVERNQVSAHETPMVSSQPSQTRYSIITEDVKPRIPELFVLQSVNLEELNLIPIKTDSDKAETNLPPAAWLFGQYNKLLPVKAVCRALLNLQQKSPCGLPVDETASMIASAACGLGDCLKKLDDKLHLSRENVLAAAFPSSASGSEGSRLRFSSQFVSGLRQGRLEGLPAALHLVGVDEAKVPRLSLTRAGAEFALLANPVLDGQIEAPGRKFSDDEIGFLLDHIRKAVPEEVSAYMTILDSITKGSNTPDAVDVHIRKRFALPKEANITKTFLTTQRTGAISRMVDLGLVERVRAGLRVTYLATQVGKQFCG